MSDLVQNGVRGGSAREIAASLEAAVRQGNLASGTVLPSVRRLAATLGVSPPTVAAALADLRRRGVVETHERRRSVISHRPPLLPGAAPPPLPPHVRDVAGGNPDPALLPPLPDLSGALGRLRVRPHLYGEAAVDPTLLRLARREFAEAGVHSADVCLVSGALDGVERALAAHLAPGDRVLVEDPGYFAVYDLVRAMGLTPVPVALDEAGLLPEALRAGLRAGAQALVLTPRAHNPTGAALDAARAEALRAALHEAPSLLVVEDDHLGPLAGAPGHTLTAGRPRWAVVRSVAKSLGPDLRLAFMAGDAETIARVSGRLAFGPGWVSHILQALVVELLRSASVRQLLRRAERTYARRRLALLDALAERGIRATGRSGFNLWIPVQEEAAVTSGLLHLGWAVAAGARYRLRSPAAIRVTCASLSDAEAVQFAADLERVLTPARGSRAA